ncbi:aspartate/glutamate racemase family protein [Bacilliculturomica massiliensis]|uniref:aspartate/glutamate racemase family protein n=1 Tax=Bacilliculturomica massiliensis TaxID=1917867 RepID=UPI00103020B0|nr:aspartate/glutamate racemase family protein [Bacilliculturomica massiliensis]
MRIKVIIPNSGMDRRTLDDRERMLARALSPDTEICVDCIGSGPDSIESNTDEVLAGTEIVRECIRAEKEGFEAVIIYCFSDLALDAARENVSIPVVGPGEVTLAAADMISDRFTVVTTVSGNIVRTRRRLMKNRTARDKMASVRALDIPVTELREDPAATKNYLAKVCREAVEQDGADTIVLGCLGMADYGDQLEREFGVKVLDPAFLAAAFAELAVRTGLLHSKRAYPAYRRGKENGL